MARTEKFSLEQVKAALIASGGVYTGAAEKLRQISPDGKCSPNTVKGYVERHPTLKAAVEEIADMNLDLAETMLLAAVAKGEAWAVCFYLKCKGKQRGWTERAEVTGPGGGPLQTQAVVTEIELPANGRGR